MRSASRARGASNFNSIKVRLELTQIYENRSSVVFQFHKGAIRTGLPLTLLQATEYFNSIKVRLERVIYEVSDTGNIDFNSIKVRLERFFAL